MPQIERAIVDEAVIVADELHKAGDSEPQGGIKKRRHDPEAHYRYDRQYDRYYGRSPGYTPWFYPGGSFDRW
jgi:hypothetical protein